MRTRRTITVVGCHAGGEVGNVVVGGVLPPPGDSVFEQMEHLRTHGDALRRLLLREPRGSVACHANLVVPATRPDCDAGFIIMEPTEYPPMSGSNTICTATVLLETGILPMSEPETVLRLEAPGGVVEVRALAGTAAAKAWSSRTSPALPIASMRRSRSTAWARSPSTSPTEACGTRSPTRPRSASRSNRTRRVTFRLPGSGSAPQPEQLPCEHPENPSITGVSIVQIAEPWQGVGAVSRNAVVVAPAGSTARQPAQGSPRAWLHSTRAGA